MNTPTSDGRYKGDTFFGLPDDPTAATHEWTGRVWQPLGPAAPASMRPDRIDGHPDSVPAGMDAIPADMPNAPAGDMPLQYDLQTFNALVAANTALQTEASASIATIERLEKWVADLQHSLKLQQKHAGEARDLHLARKAELERAVDKAAQQDREVQFMTDQRDELQRKLDRALGYIDAQIDHQQIHNDRDGAPVMPADIGPGLDSIPSAFLRNQRLGGGEAFATIRSTSYPNRRY